MGPLTGRVAVVTASTKGIGLAIAKRLCRDGASVVISSRKKANVDRALQELEQIAFGRIAGLTCHVGKVEDRSKLVDHTLEKFGRLDILVSNAGVNPHYGKLIDAEEAVWDKVFDVNVKAGFMLSKLAVPHMRKTGSGVILFISSLVGYTPFLVQKLVSQVFSNRK